MSNPAPALPSVETAGPDEHYDAITENATPKLWGHILIKGLQAGSLLGCAIAVPLAVRHYVLRRSGGSYIPTALAVVERSAGAGVFLSGGLGAYKIWGTPLDEEGIRDRVYRLHYNQGQQRTDYFSLVGMLAGGAASALLVAPRTTLGGACVGAAAGVLAHVATSQGSKTPSQMVEELKS